nr:PREDICTED: facilitated trehalose transporter Tret1-like isoform X2 [Bemisia tabaci]
MAESGDRKESLSWRCWSRTVRCSNGVTEGQSAVLLPQLKDEASPIHLTPEEETWIASLGIVLSPVSASLTGPITDAFGRKLGLVVYHIIMGIGFAVIAVAKEVWHFYVGRCICSFAIGLEVAAIVYLTETCSKEQRGLLLSTISPAFTIGVVVAYVIGGFLPWNVASAIFAAGSFLCSLGQLFGVESPAWLYKRGHTEASTRALRRLGRTQAGIRQELELFKLTVKEQSQKFHLRELLHPTVWKPFIIMTIFHLIHCATGVHHIVYYTIDFINRLGTTYDPLTVSIAISVARTIATCTIGVYFTSYVKRRFATILSGTLMTILSVGAGVYVYVWRDTAVDRRPFQWLPVACVIAYIVIGRVGVTPLPWLMSSEVFPLRVRGSMSGATFVIGTGSIFISIKMYEDLIAAFHIWGLLFIFGTACFSAVLLAVFVLPETLNKTLYEIEQYFMPKKGKKSGEQVDSTSRGEVC